MKLQPFAIPGRLRVDAEDQEPAGIEEVIGLPSTPALEAAVDAWRKRVEDAERGTRRMRQAWAMSSLKSAARDLRFGQWRDRYLRDHRPPECQPWCLGRGKRTLSDLTVTDAGGAVFTHRVDYCPCEDGARMRIEDEAERERRQASRAMADAEAIWASAQVPPRLRRYTLDSYLALPGANAALVERLRRWQRTRAWLLFSGPAGTCKTGLSFALLAEALAAGRSGLYVTMPDFLERIRLTYRRDGEGEPDASDVLASAAEVDVLLADDIGKAPLTPWGLEKVFTLVNRRDTYERQTIVTTNLTLAELEEHVGSATYDRMRGNATDPETGESFVIELTGSSRRGLAS